MACRLEEHRQSCSTASRVGDAQTISEIAAMPLSGSEAF
jgi:hypothetical protein